MNSVVTNEDCMALMAQFPDKYFELAIVDIPYGINADKMKMGTGVQKWAKGKSWDSSIPSDEYFAQLLRVSDKVIIFGGNMADLPKTMGWIVWDKMLNKDISFGDGELAWTNFLTTLKTIKIQYSGFLGADNGDRIHPTQKPIKLYKKLLQLYAKSGNKILDTHLGSGSSRIAAYELGFDFTGCELDKDYYMASEVRFLKEKRRIDLQRTQTNLF